MNPFSHFACSGPVCALDGIPDDTNAGFVHHVCTMREFQCVTVRASAAFTTPVALVVWGLLSNNGLAAKAHGQAMKAH